MDDIFRSYWWLLFPLGFFVFGAWDRWLAYRRSRDHLELIRSYTSQGKDPPPELLKAVSDPTFDAYGAADGVPPPPPFDGPYPRRYYRHYWRMRRYSPYWQWRMFFVTAAVSVGFWIGSDYADWPGVDGPFRLVAIIMGCVAVGHLISAVFSTVFRDK